MTDTRRIYRSPDVLVWGAIILGAVLRLYNSTGMGLWIDEGYTIMFARMKWPDVLGFNGAYDSHPPLYFASAKLFERIFPELTAGRMVSVVCGILTLPVLYLLARRVAGAWVALVATFLLAISPLHIWYSQEARMYVPSMLFVAVSYWALIEYLNSPRRGWAVLYGFATLLAMYFSYSSFYALLPQAVLFVLLLRKHRRDFIPLFTSLALAVLAYLPWIPQWFTAVEDADPFRVTYLGIAYEKVGTQLLEIAGVANRGFYLSQSALPWEMQPLLYWLAGASALVILVVGVMALLKSSVTALISALVLWAGTVLAAVVLSLVSPGLASRTTIYALLGWVIIAGATIVWIGKSSRWVGTLAALGCAVMVLFSLSSVGLMYSDAFKQDWETMSNDVAAVDSLNSQVLIVRPVDSTIIDAYQPGALNGLVVDTPASATASAVWFPYHDLPKFAVYHQQLEALGYERIMHKYYFNPLYLDLYVKINEPITRSHVSLPITDWSLLPSRPEDSQNTNSFLTLPGGTQAVTSPPARPDTLYLLEFDVDEADSTQVAGSLSCTGSQDQPRMTTNAVLMKRSGDQPGVQGRAAVICPSGTDRLVAKLWTGPSSQAIFSKVEVYEADSAGGAP